MIADLELESVHLADTMSPRAVADAVAEQIRALGAMPWDILRAAMFGAGYGLEDVRAVWRMVAAMPGFAVDRSDMVWEGGAL